MKSYIDRAGFLTVVPETQTEAWALDRFISDCRQGINGIIVDTQDDNQPLEGGVTVITKDDVIEGELAEDMADGFPELQ